MLIANQVFGAGMLRLFATGAAILLQSGTDNAARAAESGRSGAVHEIRREMKSLGSNTSGSNWSSTDRSALMERVVAVRDDGLELEYDFPKERRAQARSIDWEFPARVFKPRQGPMQLLNGPELEARVAFWLRKARIPRAACGSWYFTWNAFRIECDPQAVVQTLEVFDLRPGNLRDGALYLDRRATGPATLKRTRVGPRGAIFIAEFAVDPKRVRLERAQSDVIVAEIRRESLTLNDAFQAHLTEKVSGSMRITFETDSDGTVRRRTTLTRLEIRTLDGNVENEKSSEVVERRRAN